MAQSATVVRTLVAIFTISAGIATSGDLSVAPATNAESALGRPLDAPLIPFCRHYGAPVFGRYIPTSAEVRGRPSIVVAPGEYEPIQIGLYVPSVQGNARRVALSVDLDLPHSVGFLYHHRVASPWRPADEGKWYADYPGGRSVLPRYLIPASQIAEISSGEAAAFWITVRPGPDAEAGIATGKATILVEGTAVAEIPLSVEVLPFRLPRADAAMGLYYRPDRVPGFWRKEDQRAYAADMAAHGFTTTQIEGFFAEFGREEYLATGRVPLPKTAGQWIAPWTDHLDPAEYADGRVDPERLVATQVQPFIDTGVASPRQPILTVQGDYRCDNKDRVAEAFREFAARPGWPEILLQSRDEPPPWHDGPNSVDEGSLRAMLEFKRDPSCRTFTAMSGPAALAWGALHDVWIVFAGHVTPELIREADRQGAEVWTYSERLRHTNFRASRFYMGLYTWALRLKGNTSYCYAHYTRQPPAGRGADDPVWVWSSGRPSFDHVNGYVLPSERGPISGVGYEGLREGIDDFRYFRLLERAIAAAPDGDALASEARQWLAELRSRVARAALAGVFGAGEKHLWELDWLEPCEEFAPGDYAAIREKAQGYLKSLGVGATPPVSETRSRRRARGWEGESCEGLSVAECIEELRATTPTARRAAATALRFKNPGPGEEAPLAAALIANLGDVETRFPALLALRRLGPTGRGAIPTLRGLLEAEDPFTRCGALLALEAIGEDAVFAIETALDDPFPMVAGLAEECLERRR